MRNKLKGKYNNTIPYSQLAYGDLAAEVIVEEINFCNEIKLKRQFELEKKGSRKILGDFCEQIGYQPIECKVKKKIESLDLDEGLKKSLCKILLNEEGEDIYVNIVSKNSESENGIELDDFSNRESEELHSEQECNEFCECAKCYIKNLNLGINVLTKDESFILDLIDQITDPVKKRHVLETYLQEKPSSSRLSEKFKQEPYSLQKIMARVKEISNREPTISELKYEINEIKKELANIKEKIFYLENPFKSIKEKKVQFDEEEEEESEENKEKPSTSEEINFKKFTKNSNRLIPLIE
ncbi:hypothetical protein CDL12_20430 [Handroanthus impetiginosus]|uniref:Uncharacterized protein n=1 Tax=Handroanthus impetiginosus TaxID=429701 RepID=A0A2G9GPT4_9LAMI|nr:hypothetical protein CDL12_20430 [Handroanthus impetiginosus]